MQTHVQVPAGQTTPRHGEEQRGAGRGQQQEVDQHGLRRGQWVGFSSRAEVSGVEISYISYFILRVI